MIKREIDDHEQSVDRPKDVHPQRRNKIVHLMISTSLSHTSNGEPPPEKPRGPETGVPEVRPEMAMSHVPGSSI